MIDTRHVHEAAEELKGQLSTPGAALLHQEAARRGRLRRQAAVVGNAATSWGFTASGNLVLAGANTRIDFERAFPGEPRLLPASFNGIYQLHRFPRRGEGFDVSPDGDVPLIEISGATGTLSSAECELTFGVALPDDPEGPVAFSGIDLSLCAEGTTIRAVADVLVNVDYGLVFPDFGGILYLWEESESSEIAFIDPEYG